MATTRRVVKERPSRTRSTWYTIGTPGRPGRRKYACRECTGRAPSVVRPAATSACPATWPPNTRWSRSSGLCPRKMFSSIRSRSSRSTRPSAVSLISAPWSSRRCPRSERPQPPPTASQLADVRQSDHRAALFVRGREVHLGGDAPAVVTGRVGEGLPHSPQTMLRLLLDLQQLGAARVGSGAEVVVLVPVRLHGVRPGIGVPTGLRVEFAELVVLLQRGQLDPAEQRVADQHAEGARVRGDRLDL